MSVRVSRATFLRTCGAALIGVGVDTGPLAVLTPIVSDRAELARGIGPLLVRDATPSQFLPYLNTPFAAHDANAVRTRLVLREVAERPTSRNVQQFSLIFHAPPGAALRDGSHTFAHPALGNFPLFVVRVGAANNKRTVYQACFSRHLPPSAVQGADQAQTAGSVGGRDAWPNLS